MRLASIDDRRVKVSLFVAMSIFAVFVVCLNADGVKGTTIEYELKEGSDLHHWVTQSDGSQMDVWVPLSGTFQAAFLQELNAAGLILEEIDFFGIVGQAYRVTGRGYYSIIGNSTKGGVPGLQNESLRVSINELHDLRLLGAPEPHLGLSFPDISFTVGGLVEEPESGFSIRVNAAPIAAQAGRFFYRGDANADAQVNLSDGVFIIAFLLSGSVEPACVDAADANDDGAVSISDAIAILQRLFMGASPLPVPSFFCGLDPTEDDLDCQGAGACMLSGE